MDWYIVTDHNLNDRVGGGGCLATGAHVGEDCEGPWVSFPRVSTEFDASPHATICTRHLIELSKGYRTAEKQYSEDPLPVRAQPVTRGLISR